MSKSLLIPVALALSWAFPGKPAEANPPESDRLIATVKKKVAARGATRIFRLYEKPSVSNFRYRIDVCSADGTRVLQTEEFRNGVSLDSKEAFRIIDADGDGYVDIKVLAGTKDGRPWFKIWLYDPVRERFVWSRRER